MRLLLMAIFVVLIFDLFAQNKTLVNADFTFREGIYLTFDEFKSNSPSITDYSVKTHSGGTYFEFPCEDSSGNVKTCTAENVWGYCRGKNVFIHQGYGSMYFRLQVIGALIHFYAVEVNYIDEYDYRYGYPQTSTRRRTSESEKVIEWESGIAFYFNYKTFSLYLSEKDPDLYRELQGSKKKRKMIYFFLLKYNERHPVYIENTEL